MKNTFNRLNVEQMAQLLKTVITSGNCEFKCELREGKITYTSSGDLDLISVIKACEVAGKQTEEVDVNDLNPTTSWDDIVDKDTERKELLDLIDELDSDLRDNWDFIPFPDKYSMINKLVLLREDLIKLS